MHMKKRKILSIILSGLLVASSFIMPSNIKQVDAAEIQVLDTNLSEPGVGGVIVGIEGSFSCMDAGKALERINEIRKEAYDEGLTWTDGKKLGSEDHPYVALKWSKDLEKLCQIRAAEADFYMGHSRPGTSSDTWFSYNGIQSQNEILAWYSSVATGIEGWYSEKELYEK